MSNDLISREALKKDLKQFFTDGVLDGVSAKLAFNQILHDIDNAPTVDIKDQIAGAYNEGWMCGNREAEKARYKRPQGEWKVKTLSTFSQYQPDEYECPFCKTIVNYRTNFCHKCGADMRGAV